MSIEMVEIKEFLVSKDVYGRLRIRPFTAETPVRIRLGRHNFNSLAGMSVGFPQFSHKGAAAPHRLTGCRAVAATGVVLAAMPLAGLRSTPIGPASAAEA